MDTKITCSARQIPQNDVLVFFEMILEIKNKLIVLSYDDEEEHDLHPEDIDCVGVYQDIVDFNKNYKRKPKKFRRIPTKAYDLK